MCADDRHTGVKRQHMGCADGVGNGINTVHLSYVHEKTGHALIGARQWIPACHIDDPVTSEAMGLPEGMVFRTKGQLAIDIATDALADDIKCDFICGGEVYGYCPELRQFLETRGQAYVLRVPSNFRFTLASGTVVTCAETVKTLLKSARRFEVRSAGAGSKGARWYGWAWIATASPRHYLLIRRHLSSGELAFHYCYAPEGQLLTKTRLVRAAGLRWPVECDFRVWKGLLRARRVPGPAVYRAHPPRRAGHGRLGDLRDHTAAELAETTDTQAPPPTRPDQRPLPI